MISQAKQWVRDFLSLKLQGHQRKFITPYMYVLQYDNVIQKVTVTVKCITFHAGTVWCTMYPPCLPSMET